MNKPDYASIVKKIDERIAELEAEEREERKRKTWQQTKHKIVEYNKNGEHNDSDGKKDVALILSGYKGSKRAVVNAIREYMHFPTYKMAMETLEHFPVLLKVANSEVILDEIEKNVNHFIGDKGQIIFRKIEAIDEVPDFDRFDSRYGVYLKSYGDNKVQIIKIVHELLNLELVPSKNLVMNAPAMLDISLSRSEAAKLVRTIKLHGGIVEVFQY